jgi:hypothetical protein
MRRRTRRGSAPPPSLRVALGKGFKPGPHEGKLLLELLHELGGALGRPRAAERLEPCADPGHASTAQVGAAAQEAVRRPLEGGGPSPRRLAQIGKTERRQTQEGRDDLFDEGAVLVDRQQALHDHLVEHIVPRGRARRRSRRERPLRRLHPPPKRRPERLRRHRLGNVVVHARFEVALAVALHRAGGHGDDGRPAVLALQLADLARGREAVEHRHLAIHEDGVVARAATRFDRLASVLRHLYAVAELLEQPHRHLLVHLVVLRHQNAHPRRRPALPESVAGHEGGGPRRAARREHLHQAVVKVGFVDRLREVGRDPDAGGLGAVAPLADGGEEDETNRAEGLVGLDRPGQAQPVHSRHLHVEDDEVEAAAGKNALLQHGEGPGTALHRRHPEPPVAELLAQDLPVGGIVVHHEHPASEQTRGGGGRHRRLPGLTLEASGEPEGAPTSGLALEVDRPPHELDEPPGDREPQPRPPEAPGRRAVGLHEGLEQAGLHVGCDADAGVAHLETHDRSRLVRLRDRDPQDDLALLRELDRIADEVREHLAQPAGVSAQSARHVVTDEAEQLERAGLGRLRERAEDLADRPPQVEVHHVEVDAPRLDLGEVEDVVDDLEEDPARAVDDLRVLPLLGSEVGVEEEAGHADDPVHRGADLVAHVGQEVGLQARGLERGLARPDEEVDALGDQHHPRHLSPQVAPRVDGPPQPDLRAVGPLEGVLGLGDDLAGEGAGEDALVLLRHVGPELAQRAADHRRLLHPEVAQPARAVGDVPAFVVEHGHGHRGVGDDLPELLALPLQRLLRPLALGDVPSHGEEPGEGPSFENELDPLPEPDLLAGARDHRELAVGIGDALLPLVLVEPPGLLAVVGPDPLAEAGVEESALRGPEHLHHRRVEVDEAAFRVRPVDEVVRRLHELAVLGLARAEAARRLALGVEHRLALPQGAARRHRPPEGEEREAGEDGHRDRESGVQSHSGPELLRGEQ